MQRHKQSTKTNLFNMLDVSEQVCCIELKSDSF